MCGCLYAYDDFGAENPCWLALSEAPVAGIKISPRLTSKITAKSAEYVIVKAIIELANNFNIAVIALGIESKEQKEELIKLGCFFWQDL